MESLVGPAVHYCCIWNGKKKVHSHNNSDRELENLADLCLENTPCFHLWYFRSINGRTYGFLMEEGITYFTIANSSIRNPSILLFLLHMRDGYKEFSQNGFIEELVPTIQQLVADLENLPRQNAVDHISDVPSGSEAMTSTETPLLGSSSNELVERTGINMIETMDDDSSHSTRGFNLDASPEAVGAFCLQRRVSSTCCSQNQFLGHKLWLQQVKMVVAIDVLVCMALFAIWLAICNGFDCIR